MKIVLSRGRVTGSSFFRRVSLILLSFSSHLFPMSLVFPITSWFLIIVVPTMMNIRVSLLPFLVNGLGPSSFSASVTVELFLELEALPVTVTPSGRPYPNFLINGIGMRGGDRLVGDPSGNRFAFIFGLPFPRSCIPSARSVHPEGPVSRSLLCVRQCRFVSLSFVSHRLHSYIVNFI